MTKNLLQQLTDLIHTNEIYNSETGILKNKLIEDGFKNDSSLIQLLLSSPSLKTHFFTELDGGILIFNSLKFQQFLSLKDFLPDSYTSFKNKIGLTDGNGDYLSQNKNIVLNFPFKDCVLEGGQTKDDAKRKEIFWNEILAPDEIDVLLEPKILTNAKKYTIEGTEQVTEFNRNRDGVITDNLIIKGNNLIALHSLKKEFKGKVKLIYIDPPYNTGSDSFGYNDKFNHSTWLVFMKNRLEVARDLLRDDGVIFVQCDDNEQAYLKVLMDEVFGQDNFRNTILTRRFDKNLNNQFVEEGLKTMNKGCDYIHIYGKSKQTMLLPVYRITSDERQNNGYWKGFWNSPNRPTMRYDILGIEITDGQWKWNKAKTDEAINNYEIFLANNNGVTLEEYWDKSGKNEKYVRKNPSGANSGKNKGIEHWIPPSEGILRSSNWSDILTTETNPIIEFSSPKSEILICELLKLGSEVGDIVLDYHVGSGTTAAVAHKMGRQYIGVEQMDYVETISVERMKKVIGNAEISKDLLKTDIITDFDNGRISKSVNWQGGGEFVYFELKQHNQAFVESIQDAIDTKELSKIWLDIQVTGFISCKVDLKTIDTNIAEFESLSLEDGQRFLMEVLDKNMLYVNYSDIDNEDYSVSNEEKAINRSFYKLKK